MSCFVIPVVLSGIGMSCFIPIMVLEKLVPKDTCILDGQR